MKLIKVLVFPAGEINSIEIHDALATNVNVEVWGASSIERHGKYVFERYIGGVPLITDSNFIEEFNKLIDKIGIDVIFPTHDTVAEFFGDNSELINAKIVGSDRNTAEICRSKKKTYKLFNDSDFIPKYYDNIKDISEYPVFLKPDKGQGSVGTKIIYNQKDLESSVIDKNVVCEYLPGEEVTVDCISDAYGNLKGVFPRLRSRIMSGVCVNSKSMRASIEIENIAKIINEKLDFCGLWFFQLKKDKNDKFKLLEISVRCAGTMCLTRARGINLPLLSVYSVLGIDIQAIENPYNVTVDRTLISRYSIDYNYDTVYFDYDDTIIVRNRVNYNALRFLYQCYENNKKVVLITRHDGDLTESMSKYAICKNLFSDIVHITVNEEKTDYINPKNAIFIDNAFLERKKVYEKFNIPTFDVDGIEVLLDWRT